MAVKSREFRKSSAMEPMMEETAAKIRPCFPATMNWKEMKIRELLQHCLETNFADAWNELERRVRGTIKGTVVRTLFRKGTKPTRELVEDLTQDAWAKLINKDFKAFKCPWPDDHAVFAYVKTVAGSAVNDHLRRPERKIDTNKLDLDDPDKPFDLPVAAELSKISHGEVDRILDEEFGSELHFARDRAIFWYFYAQGYSAREIGELSALSTARVSYILFRMIRAVRREFRGEQEKDTR